MTSRQRRIFVGVDGSSLSDKAVKWADEQARLTGSSITLVTVWHWPVVFGAPLTGAAMAQLDFRADAQAIADKAAAELTIPADRIDVEVLEGAAGPALVKAAKGADLLVVGSQGHNPVGGALLGSVSSYCIHHAQVPVAVVR